jgi:hypothetical protein
MAYVIAAPEMMTAAAADLATIGSNISAAHQVAAAPTVAVAPAAADEVSASIAHLFSQHAANYQGMAAQAAAFHAQFVQHLTAGAFSYASIEEAIASFLQGLNLTVDQAINQAIFNLGAIGRAIVNSPVFQNTLGGIGAAIFHSPVFQNILTGIGTAVLVAAFAVLYISVALPQFLATGQILTASAFLSELLSALFRAEFGNDLHEWRSRTTADFSVRILRGGHFYLRDRQPLFKTLRPLMSTIAAA